MHVCEFVEACMNVVISNGCSVFNPSVEGTHHMYQSTTLPDVSLPHYHPVTACKAHMLHMQHTGGSYTSLHIARCIEYLSAVQSVKQAALTYAPDASSLSSVLSG